MRLETVACEAGGRLSFNSQRILDIIAISKARSEVDTRRKYMAKWWRDRWISMLAVAIQSCVSATLVDDGCCFLDGIDGPVPWLKERESREPALERTNTPDDGVSSPGERENPYPGSGRLNTLTHD